ncbi:LysR family transcriptional regulator [Seohaeicola saemankumensis]|nr:LysR family transcriptional regulator [Seohaeicola saemankumensis]MCA0872130.1 LysR family transcriptional regulator [Seohaeicola saemankumensis]
MHSTNWDDMRFVLAVVDAGTVSGAARRLGVNHATVLRRIAAFEARHGAQVFERTAQGYVVRPDRLRVIEAAEEVSRAAAAVDRLMSGLDAPLTGDVRITSTDSLCQGLLPEVIGDLHKSLPELRISLICANAHLNLSRLEAQVTVRPADKLGEGLTGDLACHMGMAVYAAPEGAEGWLGFGGTLARSRPAGWLEEQVAGGTYAAVADSFPVLRELVAAGVGRAVLPCFIADGDPRLRRLADLPVDRAVPVWVACHEDLIAVPRLSAVRHALLEALGARQARLMGGG